MNKFIYVAGFTCGTLLFIWHTWQTVYVDIPRGGSIQIAAQALLISLVLALRFGSIGKLNLRVMNFEMQLLNFVNGGGCLPLFWSYKLCGAELLPGCMVDTYTTRFQN